MTTANQFLELNNFVLAEDGVFYKDAVPEEFKYSDGVAVEQTLNKILSSAMDLSSQSSELDSQIIDWPTEYHLSSTRSNLLRVINLTGAKRVLELGCGCGSITRYLGEQQGLRVDAVEGSPVRAKLASIRCRDLDNVAIVSANFNELNLPENYYDLIVFVGVTEYAGRFSERQTDQEALQDLLDMAHRATKSDGVTLVAIENRVGLKYLHGANEDHYAVPFIGVQNYPDSQGIRTYTKIEWLEHIENAGFVDNQFFYPFPDYKVPTVILDDKIANEATQIESLLANITSRDYSSDFTFGEHELTLWKALACAKTLGDHANSFLILMAKQTGVLEQRISQCPIQNEVALPSYLLTSVDSKQQSNLDNHVNAENLAEIKYKNELINKLKNDLEGVQNNLALIEGSRGGRLLNFIRRCLGRGHNVKTKH